MSATNEDRPRSAELEQAIRQRIVQRTGGRIRGLEVRVTGDQVTINGIAACYYHKQLALQGVLEALGKPGTAQIALNVQVVCGTSAPAPEGC